MAARGSAAASGARVTLGFRHEAYGHMTRLPAAVRQALSADFE